MSIKNNMIKAAKGEPLPHLPFVPRMDIWYNSNRFVNNLPSRYKDASLRDILDDLELGYHYMIPDFNELDEPGGHDPHFPLGFYTFKTCPYRVRLHNVAVETQLHRGSLRARYTTPFGDITTESVLDDGVKASGATAPFVRKYPVQGIDDLKAAGYIFEHAEVVPCYDGYNEMAEYVGNRGVVAAFHSFGASPMHFILRVLMRLENFYYTLTDYKQEMLEFARKVGVFYDAAFKVTADSPAEVIMSGTNFNTIITPPYFFQEFILDEMKGRAEYLKKMGKLLAAHPDGENTGLLKMYRESGMHIADSICPGPMTNLSLKEIRGCLGEEVAIFGGLPSICVLNNSMNNSTFEKLVGDTFESIGSGRKIVLSISDTTPPGADLKRLKFIAKKAEEFGPIG